MTKVVHLYASQRVSRRAKDGEPGKPGISPAAYQVSFKLQNHYVYIYVTKTQGETTTTHLIGKWNDTLTCNVYINGVYTNYKDSDVMRDSYIDLWAFPSAKTIEIVLKRKSDGQQLAIGNYAIVSEFEIQVNPEVVVFDTDKDGNLTTPSKTATITCLRNGMNVTQSCVFSFDNCAHLNCSPSINSNTVIIKKITTVTVDDINIPNQNGYAQVQITDEHGEKRYAFVKFQVNIAMFVGDVYHDTKNLVSKYAEISGKVDGISGKVDDLPTRDDLTKFESSILQSARSISMEVVEKSILRRNLLRGSSFGRHDETYLSPNVIIEKNSGIDGVNCIHSSDKYSGTGDGNYIGAFWDSTQGNGVVTNIPIVKGKKYVISCWIKSDNLDLPFCIECLYMKSINQQSRDDAKIAKSEAFKVTEKNKWQKISCVLDTDNADATEYLAVNFWSNNKNVPKVTDANGKTYYPTCHAYICKPMMEEGDTYSGWTLSEEDYDYVGGNLIDNTRLLQKSDNSSAAGALTVAGGEITANGYESEYSVAHGDTTSFSSSSYLELLKWNVIGCVASNQDYVFSFLAKGTGTVSTYLYKDGSPRFFVEGSNGKKDATSTDGYASFKLTNEWKRYWVHYYLQKTTEHPLPETLLVRCYADNDVYICKPKLEIGAYMTEYTERKTDLVDKASLKKAGIEITSEQVTLYGNKVQVKTPKANPSEGYDEAAMFQNGKLNAKFINAGDVVAKGINAQEITATKLNVTGDSKIGIWSIKKDDNWGDIMQAEGTEYNGATVVSGIQYCPLFIRGGSLYTDYFRVGNSCTEFSYQSSVDHFNAVWFGMAARTVCKGSNNNMNLPTNYTYSTQYEPVQYIYSEQSKKDSPALAINVIAKGFTGTPTAIQTNGAIRGVIALNLRIMNYSGQISSSDCIVIVTKGGITLKLPAGPVVGQTLLIYSKVSSNVYIEYDSSDGYGTGKMYSDGSLQTKIRIGRAGTFTYFIFDGENWCYAYFNGSHDSA